VLNFIVIFLIYLIIFIGGLAVSNGRIGINPLYFLLSLIAVHSMFAVWSKKEPFLSRIIIAKLSLWRKKIPRKLAA
jgi:hypothetical protein